MTASISKSSSPRRRRLIGGKVNVIESTADLREHLRTDASDVNMVMVHKFMERGPRLPRVVAEALGSYGAPPSAATFGAGEQVRAHPADDRRGAPHAEPRTMLGDDNLFEAFPNATRIAFTGTPLITEQHGDKRTVKRFGEYIDTYKLMDAVRDGATLQILYEGRTADTALNDKHGFDTKFEDLFRDRTEEEIAAIKKKYGATGDILEAEKAHRRDRARPGRSLHRQHSAGRLQGAGRLPFEARRRALSERPIRRGIAQSAWSGSAAGQAGRRTHPTQIAFLKAAVVVSADAHQRAGADHRGAQGSASAGTRSRISASRSISTIPTRR